MIRIRITYLCQRIDSAHHRDWLHKFGENGILVSFCTINICRLTAKKITYPAGTKSITVDGDQVEESGESNLDRTYIW